VFFATICYVDKTSVFWRSIPYVAWLLVAVVATMVAYLLINRRRHHLTPEALSSIGTEPPPSPHSEDTSPPLL